jgi:hypothetical protein
MANRAPYFLTGANAKLKVNGVTMAYATSLNYAVVVKHASPKILGMYESFTQEPLSYDVTGSFTIVKDVRKAKDAATDRKFDVPHNSDADGNGIGNWQVKSGIGGAFGAALDVVGAPFGAAASDGRAHESFNPKKLNRSMMFDIEVYLKIGNGDPCGVARIRGVRIEQATFELSKRGIATQTFTFKACYVDEDSFNADFSGVGQHLE